MSSHWPACDHTQAGQRSGKQTCASSVHSARARGPMLLGSHFVNCFQKSWCTLFSKQPPLSSQQTPAAVSCSCRGELVRQCPAPLPSDPYYSRHTRAMRVVPQSSFTDVSCRGVLIRTPRTCVRFDKTIQSRGGVVDLPSPTHANTHCFMGRLLLSQRPRRVPLL